MGSGKGTKSRIRKKTRKNSGNFLDNLGLQGVNVIHNYGIIHNYGNIKFLCSCKWFSIFHCIEAVIWEVGNSISVLVIWFLKTSLLHFKIEKCGLRKKGQLTKYTKTFPSPRKLHIIPSLRSHLGGCYLFQRAKLFSKTIGKLTFGIISKVWDILVTK